VCGGGGVSVCVRVIVFWCVHVCARSGACKYTYGVASCNVDCLVMYQYYLCSDRFERFSTLGVCMFKGHWRPDMNEL
jgi:hypothetical protein